jgi:hypothetical protein
VWEPSRARLALSAVRLFRGTAVQYADGRIDDGSVHEPPSVYLGDDALSSSQARALAAALIATADEVDGWVTR